MPERNRVNPYGEIEAIRLRGQWMGNRGSIHRGYDIVRLWATRRWITCALEFKGLVAPKWLPGRWTALFFYDEALSLSAGHRPCALCRRPAYVRYQSATGIAGADAIDARLHAERVDGRRKRTHAMPWRELPSGAYVALDGVPHVVLTDSLRPWSPLDGYGKPRGRPSSGDSVVLTPSLSIEALAAGYPVQIAGVQ